MEMHVDNLAMRGYSARMTKQWTIEEIEARRATGDSLVTADGWCCSYTTGGGPTPRSARLYLYMPDPTIQFSMYARDARHGDWFDSYNDAQCYALNAGRLQWFRDCRLTT